MFFIGSGALRDRHAGSIVGEQQRADRREEKTQEERGKPVREGLHGHKDSESEVCKERGRNIVADIFETALCLVSLHM